MPRSRRLYVPLDTGFFEDGRVIRAGERAAYLYLNILCKVKHLEADGIIEADQIARLHVPRWQAPLEKLLVEGLLLEMEDGTYLVPSWTKWNELSHERVDRLKRDRERKAAKKAKKNRLSTGSFRAESERNPLYKQSSKQESTPTPPPVGEVLAAQAAKTKGPRP